MHCRRAYFLLLAGELLWISLLVLTPYLASKRFTLASDFFYYFFSHFCHQKPERSFFLWGEQIPVCARDVSVYVAAFFSSVVYPTVKRMCSTGLPSKWYLVVFLFPMAVDGTTQLLGFRESTNFLRFVTGLWAGLIAPFYFIPLMMSSSSVDVEDSHSSNGEGIHEVA